MIGIEMQLPEGSKSNKRLKQWLKNEWRLLFSVLIYLGVIATALIQDQIRQKETTTTVAPATVEDVRIVYKTIPGAIREHGSPVAGAVAGGLIAGSTGAIIGLASGLGSPTMSPARTVVSACSLILTTSSETLTKQYFSKGMERCALMKKGDRISITKKEYRGTITYSVNWPG